MDKLIFNSELGHADIQERILQSIKNNRLPHAFLFYGKEGSGKDAFAIEIAKLLNCEKGPLFICQKCSHCIKIGKLQHPDLRFVFPIPSPTNVKPEEIAEALQKKAENPYRRILFGTKNIYISIDTIRELKYEAKFKLYEGKKKVFIISEADQLRTEAANALLKILEEPPENLMLILTSSHLYRILPTIRSRSQLIYFPSLAGDEILKIVRKYNPNPPENISRIIRLAMGNIRLAFDFMEDNVLDRREQAIEFLRKTVMIEKSHELLNHIQTITSSRDKRSMVLLLFFLLTWFHDALHLQQQPSRTDYIINSDLVEKLNGFVKGYPRTDFQKTIGYTQQAIQDLEDVRNLNPTLIFTDLSIKLNQSIKKA